VLEDPTPSYAQLPDRQAMKAANARKITETILALEQNERWNKGDVRTRWREARHALERHTGLSPDRRPVACGELVVHASSGRHTGHDVLSSGNEKP
jgi:hypothetical protein